MKTYSLIFFLVVGLTLSGYGQYTPEKISELKRQLASASSDTARQVLAYELATGYRFSQVDSSIFYVDMSYALAKELGSPEKQAWSLSLKGATLLESGRLPESLQSQFEALKIGEQLDDLRIRGYAFNRIGNTYMELGDYRKANEYYFLSKELVRQAGDSAMFYNELSNIGNIYELLGMPDSALYYQLIVYNKSRTIDDRVDFTRPEIMFRMGNAYKAKGDNQQALTFYKKGIEEALIDNDIRNLTMNNLFLANLYRETNNPDSSMKYARNAIETGKTISFRKGIYEAATLLSNVFNDQQRYDSAYRYIYIANVEKDSLVGVGRFQELQRILLNEQEIQRVAEVKRIARQNKQKQFILLAGLGIFLVVATILYRNNQQKQKTNKVLESTLRDLKATQSQLIQSEKMASLGELTAGIAHEIQNPLNFVNNFSEVNTELIDELEQEVNKGNLDSVKLITKDIKDNEQKINHHGKRADAIVKGMLLHSRSSSGVKEPTDINALADEYLRLAYHGLRARDKTFNATMKTDFDPALGKVNVIPQDIGRVILNLITNAFYAVADKKKRFPAGQVYEPLVTVTTRKTNERVEIRVSDNGNGIPPKVMDKIFQPFFTTKPTGQGTGLGLSLSYDIVKAHGGVLTAGTQESGGAEFVIQLPGHLSS